MFYDPNWKRDVTPTEIPTIEPWQQLLKEVADTIEKRGWARDDFQVNRRVCLIGAFRVVQHGDALKPHSRNGKYNADEVAMAKRKLWSTIPSNRKQYINNSPNFWPSYPTKLSGCSSGNLQLWNDNCCRSKRDIVQLLRQAAAA